MEITKDELLEPNEKPSVAKYDPSKHYAWPKDSQFVFEGGEFGLILNALAKTIGEPEAEKYILAYKAHSIMQEALKQSVEQGIAQEIKPK